MAHGQLVPHPGFPCSAVSRITADAMRKASRLTLRFRAEGVTEALVTPPPTAAERTDELWKHTCFEAFVATEGEAGYLELNLSPSGAWAAYAFDAPRVGMRPAAVAPHTTTRQDKGVLELMAQVDVAGLSQLPDERPWRLGLTAVIEEVGGRMAYWSLVHPPGRPDFHDPVGLSLELP